MRKQLGTLTSLLFLSATAFLWAGCSSYSWNNQSSHEQPFFEEGMPYGSQSSDVVPNGPTVSSGIVDQGLGPVHPIGPGLEGATPSTGPDGSLIGAELGQGPAFQPNQELDQEPGQIPLLRKGPEYGQGPGFRHHPGCGQARDQGPSCGFPNRVAQGRSCEEPACKPPVKCHYPSSNELHCRDGIIVTAKNPSMCMLGEQYPLEVDIKACEDVCDAVVTTHLPEGVSFVRSQPEGKVEGRTITWNVGSMKKGEVRPARIWLRCENEGEQCACFCASATPVRYCSLLCAKPVLSCEKCGPEEVCPGDTVNYTITVANRGSCTAEDVVVTDNVPEGLEHSSCLRTLTFKLGSLEPCQTKRVNICFTAVKRGKVCNTAVVTACNADSTSCQWCTNVCKECVEIVKVGPREQQIGKNADYQITLTNPGDKPLTDVVVTDNAPTSTSIVAANGATVNGNQAIWRVKEIKPGDKVSFNITLTTCTPGSFTNRVHVATGQGCTACAEATTRWRGRPALNVCICDTEDPICIGDTTSYCITVVNQGSEADNNVAVTVRFPREIEPLSAVGDAAGQVSGQTVTFTPYSNFGPRQTLRYRIDARGKESGDARVTVEVSSDSIKNPIRQEESTIVN